MHTGELPLFHFFPFTLVFTGGTYNCVNLWWKNLHSVSYIVKYSLVIDQIIKLLHTSELPLFHFFPLSLLSSQGELVFCWIRDEKIYIQTVSCLFKHSLVINQIMHTGELPLFYFFPLSILSSEREIITWWKNLHSNS